MKRCPHCGGNVATFCKQCTYCNNIISTYSTSSATNSPQRSHPVITHHSPHIKPTSFSHLNPSTSFSRLNPSTSGSKVPPIYTINSFDDLRKNTPSDNQNINSFPSSPTSSNSIPENNTDSSNSQSLFTSVPSSFLPDIDTPNEQKKSSSKPKETNKISIWSSVGFYTVIYIISFTLFSIIDKNYIPSIKSEDSLLSLIVLLLTPILCFVLCLIAYFPVWIIPYICIFDVVNKVYLRHKCPHGKFRGKEINKQTGQTKCPICQAEINERLRQQQIIQAQQQIRQKYREQYYHDLAIAEEKRKSALMPDGKSIHDITPKAFEDLIANLFQKLGYKVKQTPYTNDGGKDAIIYKDGKKYLVECKRYEANQKIDRPKMQKLYAAMCEEHAAGGFFVASCQYTQTALDYGKKFRIETIGLDQLLTLLNQNNDSSSDSNLYKLTCRDCGESVFFTLWNDIEYKTCPNGHSIKNVFWDSSPQKKSHPLEII